MAEANKKNIFSVLEDFNISKVDLIIYTACVLAVVISVLLFLFFTAEKSTKAKEVTSKNHELESARMLHEREPEITTDYAQLAVKANEFRKSFFAENQLTDFVEDVKKLALEYKSTPPSVSIRPDLIRDEGPSFALPKLGNGKGPAPVGKVIFVKRAIQLSFQMTLGNYYAFLRALESCNKKIQIAPFRIASAQDSKQIDNDIKINSLVIYAYLITPEMDKDLTTTIGGTVRFDNEPTPVKFLVKPKVDSYYTVGKEKHITWEKVTIPEEDPITILPIYKTPKVIKLEPLPPPGISVYIRSGNEVGFIVNKDINKVYYGDSEKRKPIATRDGKLIDKYETLILKDITKNKDNRDIYTFEMDGRTGQLIYP